jgi:hypothetical protein
MPRPVGISASPRDCISGASPMSCIPFKVNTSAGLPVIPGTNGGTRRLKATMGRSKNGDGWLLSRVIDYREALS